MNVVTMHAPVTDSKDELFHSGKMESVAPSASLRVSRISASLGDESPEGWLCTEGGVSFSATLLSFVLYSVLYPHEIPRVKAERQSFYHCVCRVVDRRFIFQTTGHGSPETERFVLLMRRLEAFSGVRVLSYSLI